LLNGYGKIEIVEDGLTWEGTFKDNQRHGHLIYKDSINNKSYEGQYANDHWHGFGVYKDEIMYHRGMFKDGKKHGFGF
jgi:hypothetical protein